METAEPVGLFFVTLVRVFNNSITVCFLVLVPTSHQFCSSVFYVYVQSGPVKLTHLQKSMLRRSQDTCKIVTLRIFSYKYYYPLGIIFK